MSNRSETLRLTPEALSECLTAAGLSLREFCHLFDVSYDQARRWTKPSDHPKACEPPYWITPVLECMTEDHIRAAVRTMRQENAQEAVHAD